MLMETNICASEPKSGQRGSAALPGMVGTSCGASVKWVRMLVLCLGLLPALLHVNAATPGGADVLASRQIVDNGTVITVPAFDTEAKSLERELRREP